MTVTLVPVAEAEYDDFFAMLEVYDGELEPYEQTPHAQPFEIEQYRSAILDDMEGRELLWIVADGQRAGFAMVRTTPDWPDERQRIASVAEFYVVRQQRRRGVGRAAVEALLAEHRRRGTALVQASVLRENAPARAFWASLGFEVQFLQTSRRP